MHPSLPLIAAAFLAAAASAQNIRHEGLTTWTHLGSAPNWTDDVPDPTSTFGTIDRLHTETDLFYTGPSLTLQPGTFVASCQIKKFLDAVGAADLTLVAVHGGTGSVSILPVADQTVDEWVRFPNVVFTLTAPSSVSFFLENRNTSITKLNYDFDSFVLGEVPDGSVIACESMAWTWGHAWGSPYYTGLQVDTDAIFGVAEELNHVWWLDWTSPTYTLQPGLYTANVRIKKMISMAGAYPIDLEARMGSGVSSVTFETTDLVVDEFVTSPDLSFVVQQPNQTVRFKFINTSNQQLKQNYRFDAFILRRGGYATVGTACSTSLGTLDIRGAPPQLGEPHRVWIDNVPGPVMLTYGFQRADVDLSGIGMPGCRLYSIISATVGAVATNGRAMVELVMPVNPSLAGIMFFNQAVAIDPGANALGIASSARGEAEFSF